ncbi:membrane protein FxsA [Brevibacillus humidisoli]|uniref:FxsA family protein n=1 Tax=Brevibacillus humidisoli TaxID=2895522 RepID=UPI001E4E6B09|nr:FxsA family protein [Brevibacillus humidisoli]UFJ41525.1 membrane protein FxsA [Brevibacillus humidisoli]
MFRILLVLFVIVPIIELWGLISVGSAIGTLPTVLLVLATGVAGAWLAKQQGLQVLRLTQLQLAQGQMPTDVLLDGFMILVGGLLLLTPGFFTDSLGFLLLIPYTRMMIRHLLKQWLWHLIRTGKIRILFRR